MSPRASTPPPPPRRRRPGALLLAHGAGGDNDHPLFLALEAALAPLPVERMQFPYRQAGKRAVDRAPVAVEAVRQSATDLVRRAGCRPNRLVLGGRSFGGRMCSLAVAEGLPAAGLVLLSYPLHPPGKPDRLRTEHFGDLRLPCLFVSGRKDAFGTPDELESATAAIPGPVTHLWVDGGHDPAPKTHEAIVAAVRAWLADLPAS